MNDPETSKGSWEKSQAIRADFDKVATFAKSFKSVEGRMPQETEIHDWMRSQDFEYSLFNLEPSNLDYLPPGEDCVGSEWENTKPKALQEYRLCMWRSEWGEEYVIDTGETTLPASHDEYLPNWPWNIFFALMILAASLGSLFCFSPRLLQKLRARS